MTYITIEDYETYMGEAIPEEDFPRYAARASEAVDAATGWKISQSDFDAFSEFDQKQIKLAVCAQCEALWLGGIEDALGDAAGQSGFYSIGKTSIMSYGKHTDSDGGSALAIALCSKANSALFPTGLLYAGVNIR